MRITQMSAYPEAYNQGTHTLEHFETLMGKGVDIMPHVVKIRPDYTLNYITDGLSRRFVEGQKSKSEKSQYMVVEWNLSQTNLPKIRIVNDCTDTGIGKSEIVIDLERPYYYKGDTFALENLQQLRVEQPVQKISAQRWRYTCSLEGNDLEKTVNPRYISAGRTTMYRSNYHGELSTKGAFKRMHTTEVHRIYLSRQRQSLSISGDMASMLVELKKGNQVAYFKIGDREAELMDLLLLSRNNSMIFGESNHDELGRCLNVDENGTIVPSGDGVIKQIERFCDKLNYNIIDTSLFDEAIESVILKTGKKRGNQLTVICNRKGMRHVQDALKQSLVEKSPNGAWYYHLNGSDKVKVGKEYDMYQYQGNFITFVEDQSLTEHIWNRGYLIFLDTSINGSEPNVVNYTLKGRELLTGVLAGLGGLDGRTSGNIATGLDGSEMHLMSYSGVAVKNPYAGFIMQQNLFD